MYSLPVYRKHYSKTPGSLLNYYKDEFADETNNQF